MITALLIVVSVVCGWALVLRPPQTGRLTRLMRGQPAAGPPGSSGRVGGPKASGRSGDPGADSGAQRGAQSRGAGPSRTSKVDDLAFDLDLVAVCLQAGLPVERALDHAVRASGDRSGLAHVARAARWGLEDMHLDALRVERGAERGEKGGPLPHLSSVVAVMRFSGRTGVALAPLLQAHADELRRSEHRRRQVAAARLGVMLVLPLGVCVLPAFVLLGVVPVLLTLIGDLTPAFNGL